MPARITIRGIPPSKRKRFRLSITNAPIDQDVPGQITISSTLPATKKVSQSIFDADGILIKRLFDNVRRPEGFYADLWDGSLDAGGLASEGTYTARMAHHNIQPIPSKIGNNSAALANHGYFDASFAPVEMRVNPAGTHVFNILGYTESVRYMAKTELATWNRWILNIVGNSTNWNAVAGVLDDDYAYVAMQNIATFECGLLRIDLTDDSLAVWSSIGSPDGHAFGEYGAPAGYNYGGTFLSLGINPDASTLTYTPTRINVDQLGDVLAVCTPRNTEVRIIDKVTGEEYTGVGVAGQAACFTNNGKLMVAVGNDVSPYSKADWTAGGAPTTTGPITHSRTGLIIDVQNDYANNRFGVGFGGFGGDQIIALFDGVTYTEGTPFGIVGGYGSSSDATDKDRLRFGGDFDASPCGNFCFQSDGQLWVFCPPLNRLLRFTQPDVDATVDKVFEMCGPYGFSTAKNDSRRWIMEGLKGLYVDYTVTPTLDGSEGNGGAWVLDRYWGDAFYDTYRRMSVITAGVYDGRLYAILWLVPYVGSTAENYLAELTATGCRIIAAIPHTAEPFQFWDTDFNAYYMTSNTRIVKKTFQSFDGNDDPVWSAAATYLDIPDADGNGPNVNAGAGDIPIAILADGAVAIRGGDIQKDANQYQCGVLNLDGTWRWRALRETQKDLPPPTDSRGLWKPNFGPVRVSISEDGEYILYSWPGEFYYQGQACALYLFTKDGLMLDLLGDRSPQSNTALIATGSVILLSSPLQAGNANSVELVTGNDNKLYVVGAGENHAAGGFRILLDNFSSLVVDEVAVDLGSTGTFGTLTGLLGGPDIIGGVASYDDFARGDSSSVGGDWTDPTGAGKIASQMMQGVTGLSYTIDPQRGIYASGSLGDLAQCIYLPSLFGGYGYSIPEFISVHGLGMRYDPVTHVWVGAVLIYLRNPSGTNEAANGTFMMHLVTYDGSQLASIDRSQIGWLDASPGHLHAFEVGVFGGSQTEVWARLWDVTAGRVVEEIQTSVLDERFNVAGAPVVFLSRGAAITRWESLIGNKTKPQIPYRASL